MVQRSHCILTDIFWIYLIPKPCSKEKDNKVRSQLFRLEKTRNQKQESYLKYEMSEDVSTSGEITQPHENSLRILNLYMSL